MTDAFREAARDAWFAVRMMRKSPLVPATIVLCLAFSIGATATVLAWMDGVVLRPLHGVPDIERLYSLKTTTAAGHVNVSYPDLQDIRAQARAGSQISGGLAASSIRRFSLRVTATGVAQQSEPVWGLLATANYFDVLRVRPQIGRGFLASDDSVAGREPVVVISHSLWQRRLGGDPAVLGRSLWVNGQQLTIIGVTPEDFTGTIAGLAFDLWIPVTLQPLVSTSAVLADRRIRFLSAFGRMSQTSSLESANAAVRAIGARLATEHVENKDHGLIAVPLDIGPSDRIAPLMDVMFGITVLVLLIVCTNVANLLLLRGTARQHELAVRLAVGARASRLVRQLMTESLLLAVAGVLLGLAIGQWAQGTFMWTIPDSPLPIAVDTSLNPRVVGMLALIGVSTLFLFGLAPALRAARDAGRVSLTGGTRGATSSHARVRGALVGAQFALSLAVLVTAALFLRRLDELQQVDRGFRDPEQIVLATVDFEVTDSRGDVARRQSIERVTEELRALPGVRGAAAATFVPLGFFGYAPRDVHINGYEPRPGEVLSFLTNRVTGGYFETMGIPIISGRPIENTDRENSAPVAVVNEAFARRFWNGEDPIGRLMKVAEREVTVVGVAGNGKYEFTAPLDDPSPPFIYLPFAQSPTATAVLHVRTAGNAVAFLPAMRAVVAASDPDMMFLSPTTLDSYSSVPFFPLRVGAILLTTLGAAALVLAALGLYAVIAYAVAQRRREIGVRMAMGATPRRLVAGFVGEAGRYAGIGGLAGLVLAASVISLLPPYLVPRFGVASVVSFLLALATLATVAMLAALLPASRAARVNPAVALRAD